MLKLLNTRVTSPRLTTGQTRHRVGFMTKTLADLSLKEFESIANAAVANAIATTARAGLPVTGAVGGKVVRLMPDDPLLAPYLKAAEGDRGHVTQE